MAWYQPQIDGRRSIYNSQSFASSCRILLGFPESVEYTMVKALDALTQCQQEVCGRSG